MEVIVMSPPTEVPAVVVATHACLLVMSEDAHTAGVLNLVILESHGTHHSAF